jgi:hypothetical protein
MAIKTIGPAMVWECNRCGERYVGVLGDKQTREWQAHHSNDFHVSGQRDGSCSCRSESC